jgi:predicted nucleic acid-binding protein
MIADTTFLSDLLDERDRRVRGPASCFFHTHRREIIRTTIISVSEIAVLFDSSRVAWQWLRKWTVYRLHDGIANAAADIDRLLRDEGRRLGENDNWIAGFAAYYRQPVISRDRGFDRAPGVRRIPY